MIAHIKSHHQESIPYEDLKQEFIDAKVTEWEKIEKAKTLEKKVKVATSNHRRKN